MGERQLGVDVPTAFEQLDVGTPETDEPRQPGCLHTSTVRPLGAGLVDTVLTTLYVPSLGPSSPVLKNVPLRSLRHGMNFSYELTGDRGAALVTRYPTYRKDALLESRFERYAKLHYESWVTFARHKDYGNDIQPVLVSGFDMTSDFAMVAYLNEGTSPGSNATITVPMFASSPAVRGTWRARCLPHTNHGPQQRNPPPARERSTHSSPSQLREAESPTDEFNQCVFVRYYTMRKRLGIPRVIKAAAGPHDLGPKGRDGEKSPLEAEHGSDSGSDMSSVFDDWDDDRSSVTSIDSESDIAVHNPTLVRPLSHPSTFFSSSNCHFTGRKE